MTIQFPKRIKHTKVIPFIDFYLKCMKMAYDTTNLDNISVSAFSVNAKDYSKLKKLMSIYYKKNFHFLSYKRRNFEISMICLDIGPRVSNKVKQGTVKIEEDKLYAKV